VLTELASGQGFAGYRIEGVAGQGGMSVVYRATQISLDRPVALKVIAPELASDEGFRARFQRESRVLASIDHPNVIPVYEAGEAEGRLFIAMRWVDGTDLRALLTAESGLDRVRAAHIVAQVAEALDAAHERGLVHRDVKPANILIERRRGTEHAYLTDFGIARTPDSETLTRTGQWVGTLDYAAPEQIQGGRADARSDVYSLGCVLYQALTGSVPYPRDSDPAKLWAHIKDPPPVARKLRPQLSPEMDAVIARAMAKRPDRRFATAGALGRAALAAVESDAAETRPDGTAVTPAPKRRRLLYGAAAAALLAAAAVAGVVLLSSGDDSQRGNKPTPTTTANAPLPAAGEPSVKHFALKGVAPGQMAADIDGIYMVDRRTGRLLFIDRTSGLPFDKVALGRGTAGISLDTSDEGRLWAANPERGTVTEIDTERHRVVGRPARVPDRPASVAAREDDVVALGDQKLGIVLHRIDKTTHQVIGKPFRDPKGIPSDLLADFQIFLLNAQPTEIRSYDDELKQDERILRLAVPENDSIASGPIAAEMAMNVKNVAWVVLNYRDHVYVVRGDTTDNKTIGKMIDLGPGEAYDIAVDDDSVWVSNVKAGTVTRLDQKTARIVGSPIAVGDLSEKGDVAVVDGVVWVAGEDDLIRIKP
jgi:serine/threonine protein kinase